ncbi:abortive phage infection protein [Bacillus albus]|nr:abortive phage infection protein [Bacillus cereus]
MLDQLKNGEIKEYVATKDVASRGDFKHIIGNAQLGGQVIYTYSETPRS